MQGTEIARRLADIDVFASLPETARQDLAGRATRLQFRPGSVITEQGGDGASFNLITEGTAVVLVDGVERVTLGVGDYFGEIALIDRQPRSATVKAGDEGAKVAAMSALSFAPLLDDPEVCKGLLAVVCARLRKVEAAGRGSEI